MNGLYLLAVVVASSLAACGENSSGSGSDAPTTSTVANATAAGSTAHATAFTDSSGGGGGDTSGTDGATPSSGSGASSGSGTTGTASPVTWQALESTTELDIGGTLEDRAVNGVVGLHLTQAGSLLGVGLDGFSVEWGGRSSDLAATWQRGAPRPVVLLEMPDGVLFAGGIPRGASAGAGSTTVMQTGLWSSTDDGLSWQEVDAFSGSVMSLVKYEDQPYLALASGHVYRADVPQGPWEQIAESVIFNTPVDGSLHYDSQGRLYLLHSVDGIWASNDHGLQWDGLSGEVAGALLFPNDLLFAWYANDPPAVSRDGGATWQSDESLPMIRSIVALASGVVLGLGPEGVFGSLDHGTSWSHFGLATEMQSGRLFSAVELDDQRVLLAWRSGGSAGGFFLSDPVELTPNEPWASVLE